MGKKVFGYVLIVLGVLWALSGLLTMLFGHVAGLISLILASGAIYFGLKLKNAKLKFIEAPSFPAGFTATHWHQNIAIDANKKSLWVRDESGRTGVLTPGEVLGWSLESKEGSKGFVAGNMVVNNAITMHAYSKLLIKTSDLDQPVWKVKFNAHTDHLAAGGNQNYREMQEWSDRLNAFYHR